jgi:hypothetical protein
VIELTKQSGGKPCSYKELLAKLPSKKSRSEVIGLVMNSGDSGAHVSRTLMDDYEVVLGVSTIHKHRAGVCTSCNREALEQWQMTK